MADNSHNNNYNRDYENYRETRRRREERRRRKRRARNRLIALIILVAILIVAIICAYRFFRADNGGQQQETGQSVESAGTSEDTGSESESQSAASASDASTVISEAATMAAGYDYDGAIELLKTVSGYESNQEIQAAIAEYEEIKSTCVAVDVDTVPHIFYHSLINDPDRAFDSTKVDAVMISGLNAWMCTVDEFDEITQRMYDEGYVFVRLRDLVVETTDEDGTVHFTKNTNLMLPPGKKAVVLSIDDLSYYHSYEKSGYPEKLVLDDNGDVKCLYTDASGNTTIGNYDVVPRLNAFLEEHPDGAYKGARGMIALTGYDGVFGYRTDIDYKVKENLQSDQAQWLEEHPDFDYDEDVAQAKVIAQALKDEGWEFASHTWGHLSVTNKTAEQLKTDNEKWVANVGNIVGEVDTIIFAHGNDIGTWQEYTLDNEKYAYYKSAGYNFYCNVDSSQPYWVQITDSYVRQGRIDLDGYTLYQCYIGDESKTKVLGNLFSDPGSVFDTRRPQPVDTSTSKE